MEIKGSVVVITGGASGIGEFVAKDLANNGAKLVLGDVNEKELQRVIEEINSAGGNATGSVCNVANELQVSQLMDKAIENYGQINCVFANAGIIRDGLLLNPDKNTGKIKSVMPLENFKAVLEVNLVGAFLTLREGARRMIDHQCRGVLLVTSSINKVGQVGQINYSSTKAAVALWPKIISAELHMKGIQTIRTAAIAPGYTATHILNEMNQDALKEILKDVHIGRLIEPAEIAATVQFILQNEAVDGACFEITGGVTYGPKAMVK